MNVLLMNEKATLINKLFDIVLLASFLSDDIAGLREILMRKSQ